MKTLSFLGALLACAALPILPVSAQDMPAETVAAAPAPARTPGAADPAPVHPDLAGVFADFGGMPGMTALMDDFMAIMLKNPRLRPFFENSEQERIKRQLAEQFCAILGAVAGDIALTTGSRGGVYIAGGIAPRILPFLKASPFRERFERKGRFADYRAAIPTKVILHKHAALLGAARVAFAKQN